MTAALAMPEFYGSLHSRATAILSDAGKEKYLPVCFASSDTLPTG